MILQLFSPVVPPVATRVTVAPVTIFESDWVATIFAFKCALVETGRPVALLHATGVPEVKFTVTPTSVMRPRKVVTPKAAVLVYVSVVAPATPAPRTTIPATGISSAAPTPMVRSTRDFIGIPLSSRNGHTFSIWNRRTLPLACCATRPGLHRRSAAN